MAKFRPKAFARKARRARELERRFRVPHRRRPEHQSNHPLHVAMRVVPICWNLRSKRSYSRLRQAFIDALGRFSTRLIEYSVQGNHLHLIVESMNRDELSRAMKGLGVRIAKKLNQMMGRRGKVIAHRYFARALRTAEEVRTALQYVLNNHRRHMAQVKKRMSDTWIDPYSTGKWFTGWAGVTQEMRERTRDPCKGMALGVAEPETALLQYKWRMLGLIELAFVPGPRATSSAL